MKKIFALFNSLLVAGFVYADGATTFDKTPVSTVTPQTGALSATATLTPVVVTNATVGGAALSGISTVVTNLSQTTVLACTNGSISVTLSVTNMSLVYLNASSNVVTNSVVTGVGVSSATFTPTTTSVLVTDTAQTGTPVVSAPTITLQTATAGAVTISATVMTNALVNTVLIQK